MGKKKSEYERLRRLEITNFWHLMAIGFGAGIAKIAPGTVGSLAATPLCMVLLYCDLYVQLAVVAVVFLLGTHACNQAEAAMECHDHGGIVIDEFLGMFISIIALPAAWPWALVALVWFRVFDVLKPYPIRLLDEKVGGGFGVMIDDALAGLFALALSHLTVLAVTWCGLPATLS